MTIAQRRPPDGCLPPVVVDHVVDDPDAVRALVRSRGPYRMPERPGGYVWPTWHASWAVDGRLACEPAAPLFHHDGFAAAARTMSGSDHVVPWALDVNLSTPSPAQPVAHTDMPEFFGVDRTVAPSWFLQVMGASGLFEPERINAVTAVSWFHRGEGGAYRYWPAGLDRASVVHDRLWNAAVVGDNDFMAHKVEAVGPAGASTPGSVGPDATLDHDGIEWVIVDEGDESFRLADELVRLSISWTARVYDPAPAPDPLDLDVVFSRIAAELGSGLVATSTGDLFAEPSRRQLMGRWPGFAPA